MVKSFVIDGKAYNVLVTSLTRSFEITEAKGKKITQSGGVYRDLVGTYYHYQMTVMAKSEDRDGLDSFWEDISKPVNNHVCEFPYNQETLSQTMYVESGAQSLSCIKDDGNVWDEITIYFYAQKPKVIP